MGEKKPLTIVGYADKKHTFFNLLILHCFKLTHLLSVQESNGTILKPTQSDGCWRYVYAPFAHLFIITNTSWDSHITFRLNINKTGEVENTILLPYHWVMEVLSSVCRHRFLSKKRYDLSLDIFLWVKCLCKFGPQISESLDLHFLC